MCGVLAENVELSLKSGGIESAVLRHCPVAVMRAEDDKGLENDGLIASRGRSQDGAVGWDLPPPKDPQTQIARNLSQDSLVGLKLNCVVGFEEDIPNSVLARLWKDASELPFSLPLEE